MKIILKITLIVILSMNGTCSQKVNQKEDQKVTRKENQEVAKKIDQIINCEWSIHPEYDEADVIIFRSDNTYLLYDELDYEALEPEKYKYNIFFDDGILRTAFVESGNWSYNASNNQIILTNRNFIKENSEFSGSHSKEKALAFGLKKLTDKELVLCSVEKENLCDTYIRNPNYTKNENRVFYQEVTEAYSGTGNQTKEILLSGYETELKVNYEFNKQTDQLIIEDRSGKQLITATTAATNGKEEITLRGVTKLTLKIKTNSPDAKWSFKVEIK